MTIKQETALIFSGNIHRPEFGSTGLTITPPQAGEYEIKARFQADGSKLAEASFPLVVTAGETEKVTLDLVPLFVSFLIGGLLSLGGMFIYRRFYRG